MIRMMFPTDPLAQMDRLQREMQRIMNIDPGIRGLGQGGFPAVNIGTTPQSVELYAFLPGLDPAAIDLHVERGVLSIAGERAAAPTNTGAVAGEGASEGASEVASDANHQNNQCQQPVALHINERFAGRFRKVVSLPEDVDPEAISAQYRDGILHISVKRQESAQAKRIAVH